MTHLTIEERLAHNPELRARIEAIIDIAEGSKDGSETADQAEERAIVEVRKLGLEIMNSWAQRTTDNVTVQHRSKNSSVRSLKKKNFIGTQPLDA